MSFHILMLEKLSMSQMTPQEEDSWSHTPGFHQTFLHVSFPFSNFVFMVINLSHAYSYVYIPMSQYESLGLYQGALARSLISRILFNFPNSSIEVSISAFYRFQSISFAWRQWTWTYLKENTGFSSIVFISVIIC